MLSDTRVEGHNRRWDQMTNESTHLVATPGSLAEAGLGAVDPHDAHLQGLCHPCTPLHHHAMSAMPIF